MKIQKKSLTLVVTFTVMALMLSSCSKTSGTYEKLIMEELEDGGYISGAIPWRYNEETGTSIMPPVINTSIYEITEFDNVKVIKFGSVPGVSKEDIKSGNFSSRGGIFEGIPKSCVFSILEQSVGPWKNLGAKDVTAVLAEVSIAEIREASMNAGFKGPAATMFKKKVKIHNEYLNQTTRVWFLGYTVPPNPKYDDEDEYYTIKVACFEDLEYFDSLVEYQ